MQSEIGTFFDQHDRLIGKFDVRHGLASGPHLIAEGERKPGMGFEESLLGPGAYLHKAFDGNDDGIGVGASRGREHAKESAKTEGKHQQIISGGLIWINCLDQFGSLTGIIQRSRSGVVLWA
ncbi:MAG TPA: hypothetical protein VFA38_11450 [Nitrospirales bacterium]|nr:hypothetical protein [Nitrospirales bacterium]